MDGQFFQGQTIQFLGMGFILDMSGISLVGIQVFTASGTYTPTAGMAFAWCRVQAGGGAGGGADTNASAKASGGGGGGGEYREGILTAAEIGASKSVTVGAGGTGGSNAGGNGSAGGSSSIGTLIVANGGAGGTGTGSNTSSETPRSGGAGGSGGSGGSLSIPGEDGGLGIVFGAKGGDVGLGNGGSSQLGRAPKTAVLMDSAGPASTGYGAGSCGAADDDTTGTAANDGCPGIVIIMEFA